MKYRLPQPKASTDTEAWRRYRRSIRLEQFALDVINWSHLREKRNYAKMIDYRLWCLAHWAAYLNGTESPPVGAKPKDDT